VDTLDLEVPAGIVFGFLGPNGAGKTTTIRLLLGLLELTQGQAKVLGFDVGTRSRAIRQQTGALLEHSGLYERLTAEDNLEFYGRAWRLNRSERHARIKELLTHLDLWDRRKEVARTWSRGMKQKLAVARALLHRPTLVFLDEPTAGLDPVAAKALRDDLSGLVAREGITVFLTTHNLSEAEKLCTMIGVINQGRLLALGHPDELRKQSGDSRMEVLGRGFGEHVLGLLQARPEVDGAQFENSRLVISLVDHVDTAPLVSLLVNEGVQIEEVHKGKASLEQAFLTLMNEGGQEDGS
jgi:ABC-2 type transport system ATP-binding protein